MIRQSPPPGYASPEEGKSGGEGERRRGERGGKVRTALVLHVDGEERRGQVVPDVLEEGLLRRRLDRVERAKAEAREAGELASRREKARRLLGGDLDGLAGRPHAAEVDDVEVDAAAG